MGTRYTSTTVTSYNSSAPPDDGSTGADNNIKWSHVKTKIGDPVKTALESIDSKLTTFVDLGPDARSTTYTTVAGDHLKTLQCTSTFTVSLMDATSAGAGYTVNIKNYGTGVITVGRITAGNTIDGAAANVTLQPKTGGTFRVITAATGYEVIDSALPDITALAKTDGNIIVGDGTNWVAESGATARTSLGVGGLADANTWPAQQTFTTADSLGTPAKFESTNADASSGPLLLLDRNGGAGTAGDFLGDLRFGGRDSANAFENYVTLLGKIIDPTAGSEDGELIIRTIIAGAIGNRAIFGAGMYTPGATGGDKGANTINASALYDDGVLMDAQGVAKAWVLFNGTGTVAITDSFNVTSITDNGAGDYTVNFTTAFANATYSVAGHARRVTSGDVFVAGLTTDTRTTTAYRLQLVTGASALADAGEVNAIFYGDQ